jgi:hypothetical protein
MDIVYMIIFTESTSRTHARNRISRIASGRIGRI